MTNYRKVVRVLSLILVLNLIVTFSKIIIGYNLNANAIISDGIHSLSDSLSNVVGIIALTFAQKPEDHNHLYGHQKIETLASLFVSGLLFFTGGNVLYKSLIAFNDKTEIEFTKFSFVVMITTMIINIFVVIYEKKMAKKLNNSFLAADATHTLSDVFITLAVILGMILISLGAPIWIDKLLSIFIAFLVIKAGYTIFKNASYILTDSSAINNEEIAKIITQFSSVKEYHDLKNRGNEINIYIEGHLLFSPEITVYDAHEEIEKIEKAIRDYFDNYNLTFTFHAEPYIEKYSLKKEM